MQAHPGLLVKAGAEGVHCAALPDGRAVALKISDGAERARVPVLIGALRSWGLTSDVLNELGTGTVLGGGRPVGSIELAPGIFKPAS
jgi:L-asparaginase II